MQKLTGYSIFCAWLHYFNPDQLPLESFQHHFPHLQIKGNAGIGSATSPINNKIAGFIPSAMLPPPPPPPMARPVAIATSIGQTGALSGATPNMVSSAAPVSGVAAIASTGKREIWVKKVSYFGLKIPNLEWNIYKNNICCKRKIVFVYHVYSQLWYKPTHSKWWMGLHQSFYGYINVLCKTGAVKSGACWYDFEHQGGNRKSCLSSD